MNIFLHRILYQRLYKHMNNLNAAFTIFQNSSLIGDPELIYLSALIKDNVNNVVWLFMFVHVIYSTIVKHRLFSTKFLITTICAINTKKMPCFFLTISFLRN